MLRIYFVLTLSTLLLGSGCSTSGKDLRGKNTGNFAVEAKLLRDGGLNKTYRGTCFGFSVSTHSLGSSEPQYWEANVEQESTTKKVNIYGGRKISDLPGYGRAWGYSWHNYFEGCTDEVDVEKPFVLSVRSTVIPDSPTARLDFGPSK